MKIEGDDLIFSTGKKVYANRGIVGLGANGDVTEGYDGGVDTILDKCCRRDDPEYVVQADELVELADYMIAEWNGVRALAVSYREVESPVIQRLQNSPLTRWIWRWWRNAETGEIVQVRRWRKLGGAWTEYQ